MSSTSVGSSAAEPTAVDLMRILGVDVERMDEDSTTVTVDGG